MVRTLPVLALLVRTVAEVTTCQRADETTLLQGFVRHRGAHSLQPAHATSMSPDEVVEWAASDHSAAEAWVMTNPGSAATWVVDNPLAAEEIFADNPTIQQLLFSRKQNLTLLDTTKCLGGAPAGYYSDIKEDSDVWVFWTQGGGLCSNVADCQARAPTTYGNSTDWESDRRGYAVQNANCRYNPNFCAANHVYIRYCSGDLHSGQRTDTHEGFHVSGHLNFKAIIDHLLATTSLGSASRVLLTGASAGGIGVVTNADFLRDRLPGVIVKAAPMAGWFTPDSTEDHPEDQSWMVVSDFEDYSAGIATDPESALATWRTNQEWFLAYSGNCPTTEGEKCQNVPTLAAYVETPLFISENMWDSHHLSNNYGVSTNPASWSVAKQEWAVYYAKAMQASTTKIGARDGNGLFLPATIGHGEGIGNSAESSVIDDHDYWEVLGDWFFDRNNLPHVLIDACDSVQTCLIDHGLISPI